MMYDTQFWVWLTAVGFLGYAIGSTVQAIVDAAFNQGWEDMQR